MVKTLKRDASVVVVMTAGISLLFSPHPVFAAVDQVGVPLAPFIRPVPAVSPAPLCRQEDAAAVRSERAVLIEAIDTLFATMPCAPGRMDDGVSAAEAL